MHVQNVFFFYDNREYCRDSHHNKVLMQQMEPELMELFT